MSYYFASMEQTTDLPKRLGRRNTGVATFSRLRMQAVLSTKRHSRTSVAQLMTPYGIVRLFSKPHSIAQKPPHVWAILNNRRRNWDNGRLARCGCAGVFPFTPGGQLTL